MKPLKLSKLAKTWVFDLDGTICVHNGYINGGDILLDGVAQFFASLPKEDKVVFMTARPYEAEGVTKAFLDKSGLKYHALVMDCTTGERILVNDAKPSGLNMAYSVNKDRDEPLKIDLLIDEDL